MNHTPTPWSRNIAAGGKYPVIFAGRNQFVTIVSQQVDPAETEANIDFIVLACNSHEPLIEALELMIKAGEWGGMALALDEAKRALKQAKGE